MTKKDNGNDTNTEQAPVAPFKLEHDAAGVIRGYMDIAERVMNGYAECGQAKEATRALDGVPKFIKVQIDALRMYDKSSSPKVREKAGNILGMSAHQAIEDNSEK